MNKFVKVLLFILSLLLLVGLVMVLSQFLVIPFVTNFTANAMQNTVWVTVALAVVVLFFVISTLVGLLADLFAPGRKHSYERKEDVGNIEITEKSIESVANMAIAEVPGVQRYHAKVKGTPSPGKVRIDANAQLDPAASFSDTGAQIQSHVANALSNTLGIESDHIHVKLNPLSDEARAKMNVPRVQ